MSIVAETSPSESEKKVRYLGLTADSLFVYSFPCQITPTRGVESTVEKDAYSAVGGLDKQIAEVRDLIEIPLMRPELFRRFGESVLYLTNATLE